jgi:hypothetical protein
MSFASSAMVCLRRKTQIDVVDASLGFLLFFERSHFDCKIRASILAHPASNADFSSRGNDLAAFQLQHLLGTVGHAYSTAFAVILSNYMKESFFWFGHTFALFCCSPHPI